MKCPVCSKLLPTYEMENAREPGKFIVKEIPLYQISYPGNKEYLPPRCITCFEKVEAKRKKKDGSL